MNVKISSWNTKITRGFYTVEVTGLFEGKGRGNVLLARGREAFALALSAPELSEYCSLQGRFNKQTRQHASDRAEQLNKQTRV